MQYSFSFVAGDATHDCRVEKKGNMNITFYQVYQYANKFTDCRGLSHLTKLLCVNEAYTQPIKITRACMPEHASHREETTINKSGDPLNLPVLKIPLAYLT